jgi:hypothetical protein
MSLKRALIDVEHMHVQQTSESQDELSNRYLPLLASMTQLTADDKKSHRARQQEPNQPVPDLKDEIVDLLGEFDLPAPVSWRMLRNTIEILDSDKTIPILCAVVGTFPCRLCNEAARNVSWPTGGVNSMMRDDAAPTHKPVLEVLGKRMGNWKVLLSKQALKSMQDLNRSGFTPATSLPYCAMTWLTSLPRCLQPHSSKTDRSGVRMLGLEPCRFRLTEEAPEGAARVDPMWTEAVNTLASGCRV